MGRAPCCDKSTVKKGPWSPEEDSILKDFIHQHGTGGNWIALPHKAGLKRCGKSCRLRWLNYLRPDIKHGEFSDEEDRIICNLFSTIGSRWSIIAAQLPGRTDNDIKNYWNTKLKKKLITGMPPIPFSDHRIRNRCGTSPTTTNTTTTATTATTHPPLLLSISSPITTLFSSSTRMAQPTLYLQNQGVSCSCNTFPFSEAVLPVGSYVGGGGGEREGGWWEAPLEYGLEDVKQMIIDGGVEGDENNAAEGRGYL